MTIIITLWFICRYSSLNIANLNIQGSCLFPFNGSQKGNKLLEVPFSNEVKNNFYTLSYIDYSKSYATNRMANLWY